MVRRGEIWLADFDSTVGTEIQKTRPCVVISPSEMHDHLGTVIVAPMTTGNRPSLYRIEARHVCKDGLVLLGQNPHPPQKTVTEALGDVGR